MLSSKGLKDIVTAARPIIERQLDDAEQIAAFRDKVADAGGDWSALKALIKAQIQDERDESGEGKRVKKILDKAGFSTDYAELLGWSNMNEKNFSAEERFDPLTGEFLDDAPRADGGANIVTKHTEIATNEGGATETNPEAGHGAGNSHLIEPSGPDVNGHPNSPEEAPKFPTNPEEEAEAKGAATDDAEDRGEGDKDRQRSPEPGTTDGRRQGGVEHLTSVDVPAPSFLTKPPSPLRPHCQRPEMCAGVGRTHCHTCTKAMREHEEFA